MDDSSPRKAPDDRPGLAVVANVATPYRIHLHRRLAAEIPDLKLHSYFTHGRADFTWRIEGTEAIGPIFLADPRVQVDDAWVDAAMYHHIVEGTKGLPGRLGHRRLEHHALLYPAGSCSQGRQCSLHIRGGGVGEEPEASLVEAQQCTAMS